MIERLFKLWQRWIKNVSFGFADQAVFSGTNFLFNILLVRWFLPNQYGEFAVVFSIFLFLSGFQNAIILQPASVIGMVHYQENLSKYFSIVTIINIRLTTVISIVLFPIALSMAFNHYHLASSFLALAIAAPFMLFFWWFRQICYIKARPDLAWRAGFLYSIFLLGSTFALKKQGLLTSFSAFMAMALSSLFSTLIFWRYLDININSESDTKDDSLTINHILAKHWHYGRWVVGSAFVSWLSTISYLPLLGFLVGLQQAGAFRAIQNLTLPLERILSVFALLSIPWISKNRPLRGEGYVKSRLFILILVNLFLAGVYGLILIIYGNYFVKLLYVQSYSASFVWLIPYFVVISVLSALVQVLGIGLKTLERPDAIFWSEAISTVLTMTVGLYLVYIYRLQGTVIGLLMSTAAMLISLLYFLFKHFNRKKVH